LQVEYRPAARRDLFQISEYLNREVSLQLADRFLMALDHTIQQIAGFPYAGSLFLVRRMRALEIRRWPVKEFPRYLIYYAVGARKITLLRILHSARDLPRQSGL
jgi:plasmid stabilization system protein ParE